MNNIQTRFKILTKFLGVLRFILIKIVQQQRLKTKGVYVVEKNSVIHADSKGKINLGKKAHIFSNVELQSRGVLSIGDFFSINKYSRIIAFDEIIIGNNVTIAQFVTILDHDHAYNYKNNVLKLSGYKTGKIYIGSNVWVGDKATILKGVNIGNNVIIGAHTIVNKDIPDNCIVAGNPFKIIKKFHE